jgi:serine protease Do
MIRRVFLMALLSVLCPLNGSGATVELKGGGSVQGAILAEKPESLVVDLGYTVLLVPRDQILQVLESNRSSVAVDRQNPPAIAEAATSLFSETRGAGSERSVQDLVQALGESVVQVRTPGGLGSGFFVNEDGFLITNFHVIESETQISVDVYVQRSGQIERASYKDVRIVAMNKFQDLTLLKVEDEGAPKFAPAFLGDSELLAVGDRVFAIGSPLGLERTVTEGILSTKTRQLEGWLYLQTTTQINPGNSGGPLFNLKGEVVGVTNMKMTFGEGLGFAIPVESVKYFLNHRESFAYDNDNPSSPYTYLEPPGRVVQSNSNQ